MPAVSMALLLIVRRYRHSKKLFLVHMRSNISIFIFFNMKEITVKLVLHRSYISVLLFTM